MELKFDSKYIDTIDDDTIRAWTQAIRGLAPVGDPEIQKALMEKKNTKLLKELLKAVRMIAREIRAQGISGNMAEEIAMLFIRDRQKKLGLRPNMSRVKLLMLKRWASELAEEE